MTSSLVGSEMCIRDRIYHDSFDQAVDKSRKFVVPSIVEGRDVIVYISVSYTHLTLPTICSV
eukprot:11783697-Prorocentrum_lima.AAC.1